VKVVLLCVDIEVSISYWLSTQNIYALSIKPEPSVTFVPPAATKRKARWILSWERSQRRRGRHRCEGCSSGAEEEEAQAQADGVTCCRGGTGGRVQQTTCA